MLISNKNIKAFFKNIKKKIYMDNFVFSDFLTLTSKNNSLRHFFFQVIKNNNIKIQFTKKHFWNGGPKYFGYFFYFEKDRVGFVGRRLKNEYILTIFGSMSQFFFSDLVQNSSKTQWRITRLDLQCTFALVPVPSKQQMRSLYSKFLEAQEKLEYLKPKNRRRKVALESNELFCSVRVGTNKSGITAFKLYTKFEGDFAVRLEITFRNDQTIKPLFQNLKFSYFLINKHLEGIAKTKLLRPHRSAIKNFLKNEKIGQIQYNQAKASAKGDIETTKSVGKAMSKHPKTTKELQNGHKIEPENKKNRKVSNKKNQFRPSLILIAEQLQKLDEALKPIVSCLSDNQIEFLNQQFPASSWRITWRTSEQWAICPNKNEKLIKWLPIFDKLPTRTKHYNLAVTNRKKAYSELAEYFEKTTEQFRKISITKQAKDQAEALSKDQAEALSKDQAEALAEAQKLTLVSQAQQYRNETRANSFVTKLLQILENDEFFPIDNTINKLPQRQNNDFNFDDKPFYIQDIIIKKQKQKQQKTIKAFRSNFSNLQDNK